MAFIPLIDCYELLDIDPKTLRLSLKRAHLEACPHPTDARIKCLTTEQVELLAAMHARPLRPIRQSPADGPSATARLPACSSLERASGEQEAAPVLEEGELFQKLSLLERRVTQLSDQVIELATLLLNERERTLEHRLTALENSLKKGEGQPLPICSRPEGEPLRQRQSPELHPAEARKRSSLLPLLEYSADAGLSLIVTSQRGEMRLEPDTDAWFSFLASISSFRFVGKSGRFSACRNSEHGRQTRGWIAHRHIHGRDYRHYLGVTDRLTLDSLEQTAAHFQAYLTTP
jgi:hypothetical protein